MLDESHFNVAGEQGELDRSKFGECPALAAAPCGDCLAPDRSDLFAQRFVLDLPDAGKELCDFSDAVDGWLICFHRATVILAKTRWLDNNLAITPQAAGQDRRMQAANLE